MFAGSNIPSNFYLIITEDTGDITLNSWDNSCAKKNDGQIGATRSSVSLK
jgi:spore coat protein CotH